jgi:hypothetical protein
MTAKKRAALPGRRDTPHKVVNPRKIPRGIPIITIHEVHYYEDDIITVIDDSAQMLVDRGFLVPVGSGTEVRNDD